MHNETNIKNDLAYLNALINGLTDNLHVTAEDE